MSPRCCSAVTPSSSPSGRETMRRDEAIKCGNSNGRRRSPVRTRSFSRRRAAGGRAIEEQLAFAGVARERCRALELDTRLVETAELGQEIAAHARQEVVGLEQRLGGQRVDEIETGRRAM